MFHHPFYDAPRRVFFLTCAPNSQITEAITEVFYKKGVPK